MEQNGRRNSDVGVKKPLMAQIGEKLSWPHTHLVLVSSKSIVNSIERSDGPTYS